MKFVSALFAHYKQYHQHGPLMLRYCGLVGAIGFPAFYALRFTKAELPYDDLAVRIIAASLCFLLLLKDYWPTKLKPYYLAYSYFSLVFSLPLAFVFTSLKNGGGVVAVANTLMATFFIILMTDWRNTIVMLVLGFSSAALLYVMVDPDPTVPADYLARFPILMLVVIGGSFFKFAANQAAAEKIRQAYASLAGSIAHEMRNPLGQVRHSLEGMQQALPPPTLAADEQRLGADEINEIYRHLAQGSLAVKRGLQVISMTLDEVSARPVDTTAFVYLSAAEATAKAVHEYGYENPSDRRRVSLTVTEDFSFRGDETAYLFVLFNLIKNALYYLAMKPEGRLEIVVRDNQIRVRDNGPGIASDLLSELFEPFRSTGKSGGTGLGLAYCRRVMRSFGGDIACESVLGEYTEFTLRLPQVGPDETAAHHAAVMARARQDFSGKRLLVVDDDAQLRHATRVKLQPLGAVVDEAADGAMALEMLARERYDLVVLDLNMPYLDGYALAERVRQGDAHASRDACLVAHTSEPSQLASIKAAKAGMDGLVSKPCDQLQLVRALQQALAYPAARARQEASWLSGLRVVLADDNPYNRKATAAYLRHAGVEVLEAAHGQEVLDHLRLQRGCDLVLLDINMPGMSGFDTTQTIRASQAPWRGVPIVAVTAHSDESTMDAARAAGMNDFLTKPVEAAVLYAKLRQLTGRQREAPTAWMGEKARGMAVAGPIQMPTLELMAPSLLNLERLESYRRMGILQELLEGYLSEIARLTAELQQGAAQRDMVRTREILHSLVGLSGEAGAQALHQLARACYVPLVEERSWPSRSDWVEQICALSEQTTKALRAHAATVALLAAAQAK